MSHIELVNYIHTQLAANKSREEIFQILAAKGWAFNDMEAAFRLASLNLASPNKLSSHRFWSEITSNLLFRIGFASIFIINAFVAWFEPSDFTKLMESNVVFSLIGHTEILVTLVGFNDFILGLLLLFKPSKYVFLWAAAWLFGVTCLKTLNLIF